MSDPEKKVRRLGRRLGILSIALVFTLCAPLSISDWNFARAKVASFLSLKLNRDVQIGGLSACLLSMTPTIRVAGLKIGNPKWIADNKVASEFATADKVVAAVDLRELLRGHLVLDKLDIDTPRIVFLRDDAGRDNFNTDDVASTSAARSGNSSHRLPTIRNLSVHGGNIYVSDEVRKLTFKGIVESIAVDKENNLLRVNGEGTLNDKPFLLSLNGGSLVDAKSGHPYDFIVDITADKFNASGRGEFSRPFDLASVTIRLDKPSDNPKRQNRLTELGVGSAKDNS